MVMKLSDIFTALLWFVCAYTAYVLIRAIYNITLHPLAKYPGPKLYGAFTFRRYWDTYNGNQVCTTRVLHEKYGDVVRCGPNLLSFSTPQALRGT